MIGPYRGPTPGVVTVPVDGTDVDLSRLNQLGGFCRIQNLDATNFITVGVADPANGEFYPIMDILPGETYPLRLSRFLGCRYPILGTGTGTGTAGADVMLHIRADTAECDALVEAFDR